MLVEGNKLWRGVERDNALVLPVEGPGPASSADGVGLGVSLTAVDKEWQEVTACGQFTLILEISSTRDGGNRKAGTTKVETHGVDHASGADERT